MATLNMNLTLPTVSVTAGPTYATLVNQVIEDIDEHDHTSGKGVLIPAAGLNINSDLSFDDNAATDVDFVGLTSRGSAPSTSGSVYMNGSDLYFKNGSGVDIQVTSGSALAAVGSGEITYSLISSYPYAVVTGDAQKVLGITTSAARAITLPAASNAMALWIKDVTGAAATYNITITADGSDLIDGSATYTINENYAGRMLVSNGGSAWVVL